MGKERRETKSLRVTNPGLAVLPVSRNHCDMIGEESGGGVL